MTRRSRIWRVVAVLFILGNLAGAGYAVALGELSHAGTHVALMLLGAYLVWWLAPSRDAAHLAQGDSGVAVPPGEFADRLTLIEQSVDAVAIEVERIGEGQRFITRLFTENGVRRTPAGAAAEPIKSKAQEEAAPHGRRD